MPDKLLNIAKQYSSREEFKEKNLPKYLLAKRKGILNKVFPFKKVTKPLKGVYYLINNSNRVLYIGFSTTSILKAIEVHKEGPIPFHTYKYYEVYSDSDMAILALFLANRIKPPYNTNLYKNTLTVNITNYVSILGKAIHGKV